MKILTLLLAATFLAHGASAQDRFIAVSGKGAIEAQPDLIRITYMVLKSAKSDVSNAKAVVDEISANSIAALVGLGVEKDTLTSSSLVVESVKKRDRYGNTAGIDHYIVAREIEAELTDVTLYNQAIQALVDSGVTELESVSPDVSNYEELKRRALAAAAADAKQQAEFLANQLGAGLGEVRQIGSQRLQRHFEIEEIVVTADKLQNTNAPPYEFQPGDVEVTAELYVEFFLE